MVSMDQKRASSFRCPDLKLFVRDVRDVQGKKRPITVRSWATIKDVKDAIQLLIKVHVSAQRLYYGPLLTSGKELPNHRTLHDAGIDRSGQTLLLDIKDVSCNHSDSSVSSSLRYKNDICISSCMLDATPKALISIVQQARRGLNIGLKPDLALEGSGGTYFLHDSLKNKIAVFKPADEEPYADNNPRGYIRQAPGDSLRKGIVPGEACIREVAAFMLDHGGFAGVPMTTLVEARHPAFNTNGARLNVSQGGASMGSHSYMPSKSLSPSHIEKLQDTKKPGSFQEFVRFQCTIDDISPSKLSVEEVHKIAILDIRLMNADRNAANLFVRRRSDNSLELVPIDHGYCLRSVCDVCWMDWCWLDWPQLKQPVSAKHKAYIEKLNIESDAQMLIDRLNISEVAVDYFRASTALLKAGVAAGLTLYDIAVMCCRNDDLGEKPSMMEKLFDIASDLANIAVENERWHHKAASRALEDQLNSPIPQRSHLSMNKSGRKAIIRKSFSNVEFINLNSSMKSETFSNLGEDSPGLADSCASDTSSDTEEETTLEKEDCETWAEKVIADRILDQRTTLGRPHRSDSESSSSYESSEEGAFHKGFWYVAPANVETTCPDDGSVSWSVDSASPTNSAHACETENFLELSLSDKNITTPKVTFAEPTELMFHPPSTVSVSEFKNPNLVRSESGGMVRSKSYSGLVKKDNIPNSEGRRVSRFDSYENNESAYKKYFHKFIDLVIVRETNAALRNAQL